MKLGEVLAGALLFLIPCTSAARKPANSVLLSNVKSLTLREGKDTAARRVSPIPQLKCVGGNARGLYNVDVMRCTNSGADYDEDNIQWTCKASLPPEFKLGSTDVICEGYDSPDDPYILKGSCGVEYRLVLTEAGEEKYGRRGDQDGDGGSGPSTRGEKIFFGLCLTFILSVFGYAIWDCCSGRAAERNARAPRGGFGGGWGGGNDGDDNDPPPPYTPRSQPKWQSQSNRQSQVPGTQGWRPGFLTGAAAGAAGGYFAGSRAANQRTESRPVQRTGGSYGSTSPPTPSSSRYESTGFGGTQRR